MRGSVFKRCSRCGKVRRDDRRTCPQCGAKTVKWAYRAYVGRDEDGRWREQYRRGFERKADAQRALNELLVTLQDGSFVPRPTRTLGEYLTQEWLPETAPPRVRHETWADRKRNLEQHVVARIGHVRLQELSAAHLNRLYAELLANGGIAREGGLSPTTVRRIHAMLRKALNDAIRWGLLERNPTELADPPPARLGQAARRRSMSTWEPAELRRFLDATSGHRLHAAWLFASSTGVRRSELLGLRWEDLDLDRSLARVRQTIVDGPDGYVAVLAHKSVSASRTIHLDRRTVEVLRRHQADVKRLGQSLGNGWVDHGLVFPRDDGRWFNPPAISRASARAVNLAGVPRIRLHDLRHTHTSLLLAAGVNPKVVSERLGHSSVAFTLDTYAHVIPGMQPDAAQMFIDLVYSDEKEARS